MRVGTAVIICKDGCVLLGLRKGPHGRGTWGFPGGALDDEDVKPDESLDQAAERGALRECAEEIGDQIKFSKLFKHPTLPYTVRKFSNGQCWTTLYFMSRYVSGDPVLVEPHKFERWEWFSVDALPGNIFETVAPAYLDIVRATRRAAPVYGVDYSQSEVGLALSCLAAYQLHMPPPDVGGSLVSTQFRPSDPVFDSLCSLERGRHNGGYV
jgi:8-oxo-dGTP diphosphatase